MNKNLSTFRATSGLHPLWVRLTAFLSLKTPNTQATYKGIINEWCRFLDVEPGTNEAAQRLLAASEIEALSYRHTLFKMPGQAPRIHGGNRTSADVVLASSSKPQAKSTGLELTQTNNTIAKKLVVLRRLYRLFIASNLGIAKNPFESDIVEPPPRLSGQKRPTNMLGYETVKKIIEAPGVATLKQLRDTTALAMLFGCGLRRSELVNLRMVDVKKSNANTAYIYLRATKGKKDSEQTVPDFAAKYMHELFRVRQSYGAGDMDFLFTGFTGAAGKVPTNSPLSVTSLYRLFKHYCKKAGVTEFVSPHSARATAITKLLDQGFTHRDVQQFSRHASVQMVEVYDKRRTNIESNPGKKINYD